MNDDHSRHHSSQHSHSSDGLKRAARESQQLEENTIKRWLKLAKDSFDADGDSGNGSLNPA